MAEVDHEDPDVESQWCGTMRAQVARYLETQGISHGQIGAWPAWHVAPYVSVWAVESPARPGWVGWWVICGDLPTDYVSADEIKHPRMAMQAIALRWRHYCSALHDGSFPGEIGIPGVAESPTTLTPLLEARAKTLADWAEDDSLWEGA